MNNYKSGDIIEVIHKEKDKNFSAIELFAGAGGLALGISKAGFKTLGLIELNKDAADTLKLNRPDWRVIMTIYQIYPVLI